MLRLLNSSARPGFRPGCSARKKGLCKNAGYQSEKLRRTWVSTTACSTASSNRGRGQMKTKPAPAKRARRAAPATELVVLPKSPAPSKALEKSFTEVIGLIQQARQRAFQTVNTALIDLYWQVGEYHSAAASSRTAGANPRSASWRHSSAKHKLERMAFPPRTSGGCVSFTKPMPASQNSQHC